MFERLAWALALLVLAGAIRMVLRRWQRRRVTVRRAPVAGSGAATLIVVVSSRCAICPAQKNVVTQLRQRYPALQVVTIDADTQTEQARALSVMTVPTTLLQAADGGVVRINNGFIALEPLAKQVAALLRR